jgi:hypothetical protein
MPSTKFGNKWKKYDFPATPSVNVGARMRVILLFAHKSSHVKRLRAFSASICFMALSCSGPEGVERMEDVVGCYVHWTNGTHVLSIEADGSVLGRDRRRLGVAVLNTIGNASTGRVSALDVTPALVLDDDEVNVVVGSGVSARHLVTMWRGETRLSMRRRNPNEPAIGLFRRPGGCQQRPSDPGASSPGNAN